MLINIRVWIRWFCTVYLLWTWLFGLFTLLGAAFAPKTKEYKEAEKYCMFFILIAVPVIIVFLSFA